MNRRTCLRNTLRDHGFEAYREMLLRAIQRKRGHITRTAFELGVSRRHLYRALMFANLWPEVEAARRLPPSRPADPIARALMEL